MESFNGQGDASVGKRACQQPQYLSRYRGTHVYAPHEPNGNGKGRRDLYHRSVGLKNSRDPATTNMEGKGCVDHAMLLPHTNAHTKAVLTTGRK